MPSLTIGTPVADDYDGVFFTFQSLKLHHDLSDDVEFLIVDQKPDSQSGKDTKKLCKSLGCTYIEQRETFGSSVGKQAVFKNATSDFVLCVDSHVLFPLGSIQKLLQYLNENPKTDNLLQGPLLYDDHRHISTHFKTPFEWGNGALGTWDTDERGQDPESEPFEIPACGLGVFCARRESWAGFNPAFVGFGAEEVYLHKKYKLRGDKTLCLPFLRWLHRFARPLGVPYRFHMRDVMRNYCVGYLEVGAEDSEIEAMREHFRPMIGVHDTTMLIDAYYRVKNQWQSTPKDLRRR